MLLSKLKGITAMGWILLCGLMYVYRTVVVNIP